MLELGTHLGAMTLALLLGAYIAGGVVHTVDIAGTPFEPPKILLNRSRPI